MGVEMVRLIQIFGYGLQSAVRLIQIFGYRAGVISHSHDLRDAFSLRFRRETDNMRHFRVAKSAEAASDWSLWVLLANSRFRPMTNGVVKRGRTAVYWLVSLTTHYRLYVLDGKAFAL